MARYNNNRRNRMEQMNRVEEENKLPNYKKQIRNDYDLIIDDKSVYEIDSECYERARRARLSARKNSNV